MEIDNSPADLELTTGDSPSTSAVQPAAGDQPDVIVDQTQISLNEGTGAEENPDETVTSKNCLFTFILLFFVYFMQCSGADETESEDLVFSESDLAKLHEMITRQRWVVPVLPDGELPKLLRAAIDLLKRGCLLPKN